MSGFTLFTLVSNNEESDPATNKEGSIISYKTDPSMCAHKLKYKFF